jgi:hypothetical protein
MSLFCNLLQDHDYISVLIAQNQSLTTPIGPPWRIDVNTASIPMMAYERV